MVNIYAREILNMMKFRKNSVPERADTASWIKRCLAGKEKKKIYKLARAAV